MASTRVRRNRTYTLTHALPLLCCVMLVPACAQQEAKVVEYTQDISPSAGSLLMTACDYLAKAPQFSCSVEVWEDVVLPATAHKIQMARTVDVKVRRPDRLRADMTAKGAKSIYYDGKAVTVFNHTDNAYGKVAAPDTLDKTLDFASDEYGVTFPLADFLVADPYSSFTENVRIGRDLGMDITLGVKCHHLGFSQETIDWQIWIEDGSKPLIRKLVITYKQEPNSPQFTALLNKWDLETPVPESAFNFTVPAGAGKMEILPRK